MKQRFFPAKLALRRAWLVTYKESLTLKGAELGLLPPEITQRQLRCQQMIDAIDARVAADIAAKTATQHQNSTIKTEFGELSKSITNDKNLNTYTETIGQAMGIIGSDGHFDPLTYATEITGINTPEGVRITFKKNGAEGVRIYSRLVGAPDWTLLALDLHSPYIDNRPATTPTPPEAREYMAMGWLDDHEIGVISNIVVVNVV